MSIRFSQLVACSQNRIIGREGQLPWKLPADLKRFKELTMGHTLIMGRKTYDSIGRPLPGRCTIVVSRQAKTLQLPEGVYAVPDLEAAYALAAELAPRWGDESFIVGGGEIYRQSLAVTERVYLTEVELTVAGDTSYPELPAGEFFLTQEERVPSQDPGIPRCTFYVYERRRPD